jgi:hypothetical protein
MTDDDQDDMMESPEYSAAREVSRLRTQCQELERQLAQACQYIEVGRAGKTDHSVFSITFEEYVPNEHQARLLLRFGDNYNTLVMTKDIWMAFVENINAAIADDAPKPDIQRLVESL